MNNTKMINFVESTLIPDVTDRLSKGYGYTFACGWEYDAVKIAKAVAERTGFTCKATGATVYIVKRDSFAFY